MMSHIIQEGYALYRSSQLGVLQLTQDLVASLLSFHINNRSSFMLLCV